MHSLITDALVFSRTMNQEPVLGPIDLGVLIRGMVESYPEFLPSKGLIEIESDIPRVMANEPALTQCFRICWETQ